jgi:hypothetical protein
LALEAWEWSLRLDASLCCAMWLVDRCGLGRMPIGPDGGTPLPGGSTWAYGFGCKICADALIAWACCAAVVLGMPCRGNGPGGPLMLDVRECGFGELLKPARGGGVGF